MPLHRRLPKRGFNKRNRKQWNEVNLGRLQAGGGGRPAGRESPVDVKALVAAGVMRRPLDGVRLLGRRRAQGGPEAHREPCHARRQGRGGEGRRLDYADREEGAGGRRGQAQEDGAKKAKPPSRKRQAARNKTPGSASARQHAETVPACLGPSPHGRTALARPAAGARGMNRCRQGQEGPVAKGHACRAQGETAMVSAAEQLAANLNFGAFAKAEELKKRIWFTLAALLVYRLGTYIPIPGINPTAFAAAFNTQSSGMLGMINMFSGGAIERMAIFALNIMPYISASIIMQLMQSVVPSLETLKKEGEQGRKQLNQYTRYLTVALAAFQAFGIAYGLQATQRPSGAVVTDPGPFFIITTVVTLVGGTMFLMWLGEQITARGVGNGTSLIIMAGIVAGLPSAIVGCWSWRARAPCPGRCWSAAGGDAGRGCGHRLHRARPAAPAGAVSQAPDGQPHVPGRCLASAAQAQCLRRDPADLRLLAAAAADHRGAASAHASRAGVAQRHRRGPRARPAALVCDLCRADPVLRVLLHLDRAQPAGDGRQPAQVRRLPAGHPAGRQDRRVHRLRADAHHGGGRPLSGRGLRAAGAAIVLRPRQLLFRRHLAADRGQRDDGYRCADSKPPARAPV